MRTDFPTKLSLADWARVLGIHPLHFAQIDYSPQGRTVSCQAPYFQYPWQNSDRVSRDEIAQAILEAETLIERQLRTRLLPAWENQEQHLVPRPYLPEMVNALSRNVRGYPLSVQTNFGNVIAAGIRATELLEAGVAITWEGPTTYGTITVEVDEDADLCEIRVYYPGKDGKPAWEIKPLRSLSLAGTTLTITFERYLCVKDDLYQSYDPQGVVITDDESFIDEVDVYRVYNDTTDQALMLWEPVGGCGCGFAGGCPRCSYGSQSACAIPRDARLGHMAFQAASYSDGLWSLQPLSAWKAPDILQLNYYAGIQDTTQDCGAKDMDRSWKRAIAVLACSQLDRPPCDCTADVWEYWREDLSLNEGSEDFGIYRTPTGSLDNPFGTRRGAYYAWKRTLDQGQAIPRSVTAG